MGEKPKQGWPFGATKNDPEPFREATESMPHQTPKPGQKKLQDIPDRQLRAWLVKARDNGGVYMPHGHYRHYTVAQLTAEKARRAREKV